MRKTLSIITAALVLTGVPTGIAVAKDKPKPGTTTVQAGPGNSNPHNKVTLCHATGSAKNPYVVITVDANGAINGHAGSKHQDGRDIIPPFDYNHGGKVFHFSGQNWDTKGQATFNAGCKTTAGVTTTTTVPTTTTVGSTTTVNVTTTVAQTTVAVTTPKTVKPPVKAKLPKPPVKAKKKPHVFPYTL